jgi:hypothetical protein
VKGAFLRLGLIAWHRPGTFTLRRCPTKVPVPFFVTIFGSLDHLRKVAIHTKMVKVSPLEYEDGQKLLIGNLRDHVRKSDALKMVNPRRVEDSQSRRFHG